MIIDQYEYMSKLEKTKDGYLLGDIPQINKLTGYYEGDASSQSSDNPYGIPFMFTKHGNERNFSFRKGNYWQLDGNYTLSLDGEFDHMFKAGFEGRIYEMHRHMNSLPWDGNPFFDVYTDEWGGNLYTTDQDVKTKTSQPYKPYRGSLYVLDQITYKGIIMTPGVRFDFFSPNSQYRVQADSNFTPISSTTGFADAKTKFQVSPRINITYPITERSNISIAYGLYFKMPELQSLYDAFAVEQLRGNAVLGDPNLEAQRTNAYQVAYNNQLSDDFALTISAYYRDVYNQLGERYIPALPQPFFISSITEYGNAKGIEFTFIKRLTDHFGFTLNYTLSQAVGTSSGPGDNYLVPIDPYTGAASYPLSEYPMDYDRRHRINAIINFAWMDGEGPSIAGIRPLENTFFNFTGFFQTGTPYTPVDMQGNAIGEVNSERGPSYWSVDFRLNKAFKMRDIFGDGAGNSQIEFFIDINNILNRTAVAGFYTRTGDPDDDGVSFYRTPSAFSATTYYKEADYGNPESFSTDQYDMYGNRYYNENADFDGNGLVTQQEKYDSYVNYLKDVRSLRGNYQLPRTVYLGLMFRF